MKRHATNCKFCKLPITLEIDDAYAALGDPLRLLALSSCNRCADLRVEKRRLEGRMGFVCGKLVRAGKLDDDEKKQHLEGLTSLTQQYAGMIARWNHKEGMAWDESIPQAVLDSPGNWGQVLGGMWHHFKVTMREQEASLPL